MAETAAPEMFVNIPNLEITVADVFTFARGQYVYSASVGPTGSFQCSLKVYPAGTQRPDADPNALPEELAAFLEIIPPKHLRNCWSCSDIRFEIALIDMSTPRSSREIRCKNKFSFCTKQKNRGWLDFLLNQPLRAFASRDGQLRLVAKVFDLPYVQPPPELPQPLFPGFNFSTGTKMITFRLADGSSLFLDQRLLTARSTYFQLMFSSDEWQESKQGEVDFMDDPHVTNPVMQAILQFILTDSFQAEGSLPFTMEVRKLADRFCLEALVQKVDAEVESMLSEENVLKILSETFETGCGIEKSCWKMLEDDSSMLTRQEEDLDELIASKPRLARKLILLGRTKRPRTG